MNFSLMLQIIFDWYYDLFFTSGTENYFSIGAENYLFTVSWIYFLAYNTLRAYD